MRELRGRDPALAKILPPVRLPAEGRFVRSIYAYPYEFEGRQLWFNMLTRQLVELSGPMPEQATAGQICGDEELTHLTKGYYLVPEERDETVFYHRIFQILHAMAVKKGVKGFTILTTSACNARCVYCFEEGRPQQTMTAKTAVQVVDYIAKVRRPEEIQIQWFGGEPLAAPHIIDLICKGLNEKKIPFTAGMTTNGSLITEEIADRMAGPWKVRHVQVSMDGDEQDYIARKRYVSPDDQYHTVLRAVRLLTEREIRVAVRCNVDEENFDTVDRFLSDLTQAVPNKENVNIYVTGLYQARSSERSVELWKKIIAFRPKITAAGFPGRDVRFILHNLRKHHCMADLGSVVITPEGGLYACEYYSEESRFGNIFSEKSCSGSAFLQESAAGSSCSQENAAGRLPDGETGKQPGLDLEAWKRFCRVDRLKEECAGCRYLPECTPFASCPVPESRCWEVRDLCLQEQIRGYLEANYTTQVLHEKPGKTGISGAG